MKAGEVIVSVGESAGALEAIARLTAAGNAAWNGSNLGKDLNDLVQAIKGTDGNSLSDGVSNSSYDDLPQNAKDAYDKYDKAGWKGNVSGQTEGTNAGRKWRNKDAQLPTVDSNGNPITYREFDVNNYNGIQRDSE